MYSGVGLQYQSGGLPDSDIVLPGRLGEVELSGVLTLLEKDQELQDLLCDVQVYKYTFYSSFKQICHSEAA